MDSFPVLDNYCNYMLAVLGRSELTVKEYRYDLVAFFRYYKLDHKMVPAGTEFTKIGRDFADAESIGEYTIRSVDIDLGGHMNNVNYIRAMLGCFDSGQIESMDIHDIEVQYISQSYEGEALDFRIRLMPDGTREIGAVKKDGKAAFIARLS